MDDDMIYDEKHASWLRIQRLFPSCPTIHLQALADDFLEKEEEKDDSK